MRHDALTKLVAPNIEGWGGLDYLSVVQTDANEFILSFFIIVHIFGIFKTIILEKISSFWMLFGTLFCN
ncbi:hypothetical protein HMPREF0650_1688 [Hoylesella buccalis ATCC 35310]|uniref:Uncharacterized protein n=1 Tax=Hoylesella buccalis ATCC 35310 TaxID=679190 RepID=D1W3E5_9BACT|nr:hypothetical protein HMPREF0650_1688 [Hoylesella buccalis ATCC 35310]